MAESRKREDGKGIPERERKTRLFQSFKLVPAKPLFRKPELKLEPTNYGSTDR
jgi:hypothetical protein